MNIPRPLGKAPRKPKPKRRIFLPRKVWVVVEGKEMSFLHHADGTVYLRLKSGNLQRVQDPAIIDAIRKAR